MTLKPTQQMVTHFARTAAIALFLPLLGLAQFSASSPVREYIRMGGRLLAVENQSTGGALGDNSFFVTQQYIDLLGDSPGPAELASGVTALDGGTPRNQYAYSLYTGAEFQGREWFIAGAYQVVLGRDTTYAEWNLKVPLMLGGLSKDGLTAQLLPNPAVGTNTDFVNLLYLNAFKRVRPPADTFWITVLDGGTTRASVATAFIVSPEFAIDYGNRLFVILRYCGYLRRTADSGGLSFFLGELIGRLSQPVVLDQFLTSLESLLSKLAATRSF